MAPYSRLAIPAQHTSAQTVQVPSLPDAVCGGASGTDPASFTHVLADVPASWKGRCPLLPRAFAAALLCASLAPPAEAVLPQQRVNPDAKVLADFQKRVQDYVALHKKLEASLPHLPKEANPQQIDNHQRELGKLMREARAGAKPGDLLTPDMQQQVRRLMRQVFKGTQGKQLLGSIFDENPVDVPLTVNGRYPDTVPLSTVPPQVLLNLPTLPEDLEYRFVGRRLILLDTHAHMIADYMDRALP